MKKRLLLGLMAACSMASGYAFTEGELVYTPQGRFHVTGANVAASNFSDLTGWTLISASTEKTLADQFNVNANGYAEGVNSVVSLDATAGEGMYFKFSPSSSEDIFVVSFKMKGAFATTTRIKTDALSTNLVRVKGNSGADFGADSADYICCNTAEELTEQWQTFNYAIVGDGVARSYYIQFTGMDTNIEIADLQIAPAEQVADLRQRDAMLQRINAYIECYAWDGALLSDAGMTEAVEGLKAIGDASTQTDLEEALATAEGVLGDFLDANMDDYLAGNNDNYFKTWRAKTQKASTYGVWSGYPSGRLFWESNGTPFDLGHYQQSATWSGGSPTSPMGVYTQKEMTKGAYVFAIEAGGAFRENLKQTWANDDGMKPCYGVAYVVKIVDGAATDTIAKLVQDVSNVFYVDDSKGDRRYNGLTPFIITANIEEAGTYEFGMMVYCKEEYQSLARGSVGYIYNASIWGKNDNKYNQKQLGYEADVREQITTGRSELTKAAENLANADLLWGKDELKACVDTVESKIAGYELLTQDDIIATFDDGLYVKSTSDAETGLMVYEVYQNAVKDIIAANRKFTAVNDTLNSMQTVIDAAESTMALRIYGAAEGKADLQTAIDANKALQTQMKAGQYSEENAAAIVQANDALNAAIEAFKASVPATAFTTLVDIDFANDPVLNEENQHYSIAGTAGSMEFSNFTIEADPTSNYEYQQGRWVNGEQRYKNYIRVGNGTGTVVFNPGDMGTNIMKVNCDFYLQGLSGRYVGFYLDAATDSTDVTVASFYANYYDNKIDATSTLPIELSSLQYGSGGSYANQAPEGAEGAEGNYLLAKNSFEVILDFGEQSIYATTTSRKGVVTTRKIGFDGTVPTKFVLKSNYVNNDRRIWFSNLKIQTIKAGETEKYVDGIATVNAAVREAGAIYNLNGVRVAAPTQKGIYIINGKKVVVK